MPTMLLSTLSALSCAAAHMPSSPPSTLVEVSATFVLSSAAGGGSTLRDRTARVNSRCARPCCAGADTGILQSCCRGRTVQARPIPRPMGGGAHSGGSGRRHAPREIKRQRFQVNRCLSAPGGPPNGTDHSFEIGMRRRKDIVQSLDKALGKGVAGTHKRRGYKLCSPPKSLRSSFKYCRMASRSFAWSACRMAL